MRFADLWRVLRVKRGRFLIWLLANLGGLVVAYFATFTIWLVHQDFVNFVPGPEVILIAGTISVAVAGASHSIIRPPTSVALSPAITVSWSFLVAVVYGFLIAFGVKDPAIDDAYLWLIAVVIAVLCWSWSSVIWLHEQGIQMEAEQEPEIPVGPPTALQSAAEDLPRLAQ